MHMKTLVVVVWCLCTMASAWAKEAVPLAEDPLVELRLIVISEEMRCLVCQNESLAGSRAELAQDLRRELRVLIQQGKSDADIKAFMVARYGDFVLYRPPVSQRTWLLWLGPFALLLWALVMLLRHLRTLKPLETPRELSAQEQQRVQELMQKDAP
ncbi:cytochrome c-type biogenesis protein CcmH [Limnohabitans sp.]|jgi:cytochrome c-type biogenesis protein CcmH|uniref:cytochrome c-type biogenesis protein n=1 Tax=Limnohabitans sp. TaxID=1907725 RepID=UPI0038BB97CB